MVIGQKNKISFCTKSFAFAIGCAAFLLFLSNAPAVAQKKEDGSLRPAQNIEFYKTRVSHFQFSEPQLARQYADSMLLAAGAAADSIAMAESMKTIADLQANIGDFAQAVLWYHRALAIANKQRDRLLAVRIHNNLGGVYLKTSHHDKALTQYNKAYSLGRSSLSDRQKAVLLNNLGIIYRQLKQYNQAKLYLEEALELEEGIGNLQGIGQVYNNMGILYHEMGKPEQGLAYYHKAREYAEKSNRPSGIAYALTNIGTLLIEQQQPKKALPFLYRSQSIKKSLQDKLGLFNSHQKLGDAWIMLKQADSAIFHYAAANLYADSIANVNMKIEALLGLAKIYELKNRTEALPALYERILALKDSSFTEERAAELAIAQAEMEMTRKEAAIQELTEEAEEASDKLRVQEAILFLALPLVLLLTIFIIFYVRRYRSERSAHRELQQNHLEIRAQKEQIERQHCTIQQQNLELQDANKLIEHYNAELQEVNEQLEDKIRERTKALADTYRKLSFHINNTPLAVLEWSKSLTLVRWPEQAEQMFGYKTQQVLGKTAEELPFMQDEEHLLFLENIRTTEDGLQARKLSFQQELKTADGDPLFVEWSHSVLTDENGQVESVLSLVNDVSLREKAFQEISLINQELDTFIYKASHDLRGPIARMQGIINLGKLESQDPQAHFYFDLLNRVSNELHNLLMRLLMVHNIHQHLLQPETLSFHNFVDGLIKELPAQQKSSAFTFYNKIPENLYIHSDKNLLSIILLNLLDNSLTFADNLNPYVVVTAKVAAGNRLRFSVQDNGPGISESLYEKVFDMFFQGSTKSTGMGLGLYMVRKAVRRLGGEVKLERKDNLTTFTVVLPETDLMRICTAPKPTKVTAA